MFHYAMLNFTLPQVRSTMTALLLIDPMYLAKLDAVGTQVGRQ